MILLSNRLQSINYYIFWQFSAIYIWSIIVFHRKRLLICFLKPKVKLLRLFLAQDQLIFHLKFSFFWLQIYLLEIKPATDFINLSESISRLAFLAWSFYLPNQNRFLEIVTISIPVILFIMSSYKVMEKLYISFVYTPDRKRSYIVTLILFPNLHIFGLWTHHTPGFITILSFCPCDLLIVCP